MKIIDILKLSNETTEIFLDKKKSRFQNYLDNNIRMSDGILVPFLLLLLFGVPVSAISLHNVIFNISPENPPTLGGFSFILLTCIAIILPILAYIIKRDEDYIKKYRKESFKILSKELDFINKGEMRYLRFAADKILKDIEVLNETDKEKISKKLTLEKLKEEFETNRKKHKKEESSQYKEIKSQYIKGNKE